MKRFSVLWFLLGLGSELQLVASLSFTELYILIATPLIFRQEYPIMRRNEVQVLFWLSVLVIVGGCVSIFLYHPPGYYVLRKMATVVLVSCSIVYMHSILRRDPLGVKWFFLGGAISLVLCTFIFQQSVEISLYGADAEEIINGPIYWIRRLSAFVTLPLKGWYLQTPTAVCVFLSLFIAIFSMLTSTSGRSAALNALACVVLIVLGGKKIRTMRGVQRMFWLLVVGAVIFVNVANFTYKKLAQSGVLGEKALNKYEVQTKLGTGVWGVIMGGRADSIAPFYICAKHSPLFGFGLCPIDDAGHYVEFVTKYGAPEDIERMWKDRMAGRRDGGFFIPGHSCMGSFWLHYGLVGLIFWLYACYVIIRFIRNDASAVPQWYGWLACGAPGMFWTIFFSPFAFRVTLPMYLVACLLAGAVRRGTMKLPTAALDEIQRYCL